MADDTDKSNGVFVEVDGESEDSNFKISKEKTQEEEAKSTLLNVFNNLVSETFSSSVPLIQRIRGSVSDNVPLLRKASQNTARDVYSWTCKGSHLRALLVVSVGIIALLALTGLLLFMIFFIAATINAIVISLLISLAAAGGFLALLFACVAAIYIGALSLAIFVISIMTIATIVAVLVVTGWIGLFLSIWLVTKKSASLAKHLLSVTGSALSAYSSARLE